MRMLLMIASAAAMAVSMPALAEKGGKRGGGGGNGSGGKSAQAHGGGHGGGGGKARGVDNGGGGGQAMRAQRQPQQAFRGGGGGKPDKAQRKAFRGGGKPDKAEPRVVREARADRAPKPERRNQHAQEQRTVRIDTRDDFSNARDSGFDGRYSDSQYDSGRFVSYASGQSCPPGLAKKGNGCLSPGQARKIYAMGQRIEQPWYGGYNIPAQYSAFYQDTQDYSYRYDDNGYIYRLDNGSNMISGLIPLLGGGFAVGQPLPAGYDVYNVPYQYRDDYYDNGEDMYRYGDNAIYRADADSGMIESIVALLTGDMNVGQQLPEGYDAYNVPMEYRDEYPDTDDYDYRYADGNIYQVDTKTQIIQAIVEMIA